MFNILSKYDNYKNIFEKFRSTNEFKVSLFECQAKFPAYSLGTHDTSRATLEMYVSFEDWLFNLDNSISDLEYTAFLDSYGSKLKSSIYEHFLSCDTTKEHNVANPELAN